MIWVYILLVASYASLSGTYFVESNLLKIGLVGVTCIFLFVAIAIKKKIEKKDGYRSR